MTVLRKVPVCLPGGIYEDLDPHVYVELVRDGALEHQPGVEAREAWEAFAGPRRHGDFAPADLKDNSKER